MRIDLHQALGDIAASVEDDVAGDRLGGRVHHMVTRVRRRRAARYAAQGAVGVGTAAAVAVVGVNLAGDRGPDAAPPATATPEPGPDRGGGQDDVRRLVCGQTVPEPSGVRNGLELAIDVPRTVAASAPVTVTGEMRNVGSSTVRLDGGSSADLEVVAVVDGLVAGTMAPPGTSGGEIPADGRLRAGDAATMTEETRLAGCDDAPVRLPEGDYHLVGRTAWVVDGERVELVSEPVPFTVGDHASDGDVEPYGPESGTGSADDAGFAVAEDVIQGYLADPAVTLNVPTCGGRLPVAPIDIASLTISTHRTLSSGTEQPVSAGLTLLERVRVRGGLTTSTATVLLMKDGVVVGGDTEAFKGAPVDEIDGLDPGALWYLPTLLRTEVCGASDEDGPLPLPPGTYEAVAVAAIGVAGTVEVDGDPLPLNGPTTAYSSPLEVTIE